MISKGESHNFLERAYLRHYAYLSRVYPQRSARNIYHLATLGLSGLVSWVLLALIAVVSLAVSLLMDRPVVPWGLPNRVVLAGSAAIVFLPGWAGVGSARKPGGARSAQTLAFCDVLRMTRVSL